MVNVVLKEGVNWVGVIDWNIRDFHGYITSRGSTYNAYLISDEKIALVDTVKSNSQRAYRAHLGVNKP